MEHIGTVRNSGTASGPSERPEAAAVADAPENPGQAYTNMDLNNKSQPELNETQSAHMNVYGNFHYKSQGSSQLKTAAFNYANNKVDITDVQENLFVKPMQMQAKGENLKQQIHSKAAQQGRHLHRINLSNIAGMRKNQNTSSIPKSEIRDYMSVNTDDAESRFD